MTLSVSSSSSWAACTSSRRLFGERSGFPPTRVQSWFPELRDDPTESPERELHYLDILRARIRWQVLHDDTDDDGEWDSEYAS